MNKTLMSLFGVSLMLVLMSSCDKDETLAVENFSSLINLEVGNFWVYESGTISEEGSLENPKIDTVVVLHKVFEEGVELFELSGSFGLGSQEKSFVYDSLNYLIDYPSRVVLFTTDTSYISKLDNQFIEGESRIRTEVETVDVPAGTFESYNFKGLFNAKDPNYEFGQLQSNFHLVLGVGLVKSNAQFVSSGIKIEKRLLNFGKI